MDDHCINGCVIDPTKRAPKKAKIAKTAADIWHEAETVFLCLPKGENCKTVLQSLIECNDRVTSTVIELSTIGMPMAKEIDEMLRPINVNYFDSPMSGGACRSSRGNPKQLNLIPESAEMSLI